MVEFFSKEIHASAAMENRVRQLFAYAETAGRNISDYFEILRNEGKIPCRDKREGKAALDRLCELLQYDPEEIRKEYPEEGFTNLHGSSSRVIPLTAPTLLFPAYCLSASGIGIVMLTDRPFTFVILFVPVASYKDISIAKYLMGVISPYFCESAVATSLAASLLSVILTIKLSVEPLTEAYALSTFDIPGFDISTTVPVFLLGTVPVPVVPVLVETLVLVLDELVLSLYVAVTIQSPAGILSVVALEVVL